MLEGLGCHATVAASGVEALAALAYERFDMVFMDCQMPEMDGFEAVRRFRDGGEASANPNDLPIVALTANALVGDADRCLAAGFDDYVSKPFTQRQIEGLVRKWARGERDALVTSPGALGLSELGATIENLAQSRRLGEAVAHISELERQHARVAAAIDALEGSVRRST